MFKTDEEMRSAGPPERYDNTMLTTSDSCMRKFYFFWRGLDFKQKPSYFTFGSAWQRGQEVWYTTPGEIEDRLGAAITAAEQYWEDDGGIENNNDTKENLKYLLMFYAIEYETESWQIIAPAGKMELGFEFPIEGTPYYLCGAIDGYISWPGYGLLVLENKTAGVYLGDSYMSQWSFSPQVTQYFWGLGKATGEEPFGVLMNIASKKLTKKAIQEFKQNMVLPENIFMRNLEKRSRFQIEEFEDHTIAAIREIVREWDRWLWPKTKDHMQCSGGIGKSPCLFKRLCLADIHPWEMEEQELLGPEIKWRGEKWEPWKRGEK